MSKSWIVMSRNSPPERAMYSSGGGPGSRDILFAEDAEASLMPFGQGTPRALVVLNPTARKHTLRTLDMLATVDREEFFGFQHGDGRLRLIERLSAAYRAGERPDSMLEFPASLTTRTTRTTS